MTHSTDASSSNLDLFWKHNIISYYITTARKAVFHRAMFTLLRFNYEASTEPDTKISHDSLSDFGEVRTPFIIAKKKGREIIFGCGYGGTNENIQSIKR